jgi:hypothetical protein
MTFTSFARCCNTLAISTKLRVTFVFIGSKLVCVRDMNEKYNHQRLFQNVQVK